MKKKILIVDDDIDIIEPLSIILEQEAYDVESITKGEQTFSKITTYKPDLILLDILMSGSDGRIICKNLKKDKNLKQIPVILLSAHPGAEKDSENSGANDFIAKPFEIDMLLAKISHYI